MEKYETRTITLKEWRIEVEKRGDIKKLKYINWLNLLKDSN